MGVTTGFAAGFFAGAALAATGAVFLLAVALGAGAFATLAFAFALALAAGGGATTFFTGAFATAAGLVTGFLATSLLAALAGGFFATALGAAGAGLPFAFTGAGFTALPDALDCALGVLFATVPPPEFRLIFKAINGKTLN
jgi:hypothetical protein